MIYQYAINIERITDFNQVVSLISNLSDERKSKINRFLFEKDKIRSVIAEALLRYALSDRFDLKDERIKFDYTEYGKPFLVSIKDIFFNMSHSGEWVVCSVGDSAIGVDVETMKYITLPGIYKFFSKSEIQLLDGMSEEKQVENFYKIWTLKESFVKMNGMGLSYSFEKFSFEFEDEDIKLTDGNIIQSDYYFISKKMDQNHWYALCTAKQAIVQDMEMVTLDTLLERI